MLAFEGHDDNGKSMRIVVEVVTGNGTDTGLTELLIFSKHEYWVCEPLAIRFQQEGASFIRAHPKAMVNDGDQPTALHHAAFCALIYTLFLLHHHAVVYEMATSGTGQRRYNNSLHRKQPPIPPPACSRPQQGQGRAHPDHHAGRGQRNRLTEVAA